MNIEKKNKLSSVVVEELPIGIWILRLGSDEESVITLNETRLISFQHAIARAKQSRVKGIIITGPRDDMFCAGADVKLINDVTDAEIGHRLAKQGQKVFDDLASLPFPTVAAISGPCVGGGYELSLACKYRVATDHKTTLIGLPETRLGILPGFGGTQRLPRLIGIRKALDVILAGKTLRSKQALNYGLVDGISSTKQLLEVAQSIILKKENTVKSHKMGVIDQILTFTSFGRSFVKGSAAKSLMRQTKGFYPAPPAALETVIYGLKHGIREGLDAEARWLGKLITTPECKSLVHIFFLTENAKRIGRNAVEHIGSWQMAVAGAGVMGSGIAQLFAQNELPVDLFDTDKNALQKSAKNLSDNLSKIHYLSEAQREEIKKRITLKDDAVSNQSKFFIEAIIEDINIKKILFEKFTQHLSNEALIATNTSSLSITEMAKSIPYPKRFIGMHFFNPVYKMPLVEIVRGKETGDDTVVLTAALANKLGKYPVVVEDVPGFLVNRILTPYLNTALHLLSKGLSIVDIDKAATDFGMPMGPFRLLDEVGLDVAAHVSLVMKEGYGQRMASPDFAKKLIENGRKGKKNGKGFYEYKAKEILPFNDLYNLLRITEAKEHNISKADIQSALILSLAKEALICFDEGVAGIPSDESAGQIDLATVMGIGFPPFRGGLMWYVQSIGRDNIDKNYKNLKDNGLIG